MRREVLAELSSCFFRLPHVNDTEAIRPFSGRMSQEPVHGPIRRRLGAIFPHHAAKDLLVTLPRDVWALVNEHNCHLYLLLSGDGATLNAIPEAHEPARKFSLPATTI
jgi:hypothetical protein